MDTTKDFETTWWIEKENVEAWLETEEFHYIWRAMTGNLLGNIVVGAYDEVIKQATNHTKPGIIGGFMNTDHSNLGGKHWVLWTYSRDDGMKIYDPKGDDSF